MKFNKLVPYLNIKKVDSFAYFHKSYMSRNNIYDHQSDLRWVGGVYYTLLAWLEMAPKNVHLGKVLELFKILLELDRYKNR